VKRISAEDREKAIDECRRAFAEGDIVAFPTETFYGLGVKYDDPEALARLSALKRRPKDKAMPLIIGDRKVLPLISPSAGPIAERLMEKFWPGPLTLLIAARSGLSEFITAGSGKVAVRVPGSSFALSLSASLGFPVTATSANVSGMPPATHPEEVIRYFGKAVALIVDGGKTPGGKPSTIVDVTEGGIKVVRPGAIPEEDIYGAVGALQRK
jgi:L-threonylcarbamoyladenylate synthase